MSVCTRLSQRCTMAMMPFTDMRCCCAAEAGAGQYLALQARCKQAELWAHISQYNAVGRGALVARVQQRINGCLVVARSLQPCSNPLGAPSCALTSWHRKDRHGCPPEVVDCMVGWQGSLTPGCATKTA